MDLSRLESLTREMLEAEARRRGIKSPEFRTRTELLRLIVRHQYGEQIEASRERIEQGVNTVRLAREVVSSAVSAAMSALPARLDVLGLWSGRASLPRQEPPLRPRPGARAGAHERASTAPGSAREDAASSDGPSASFAPFAMTPQIRPSSMPPRPQAAEPSAEATSAPEGAASTTRTPAGKTPVTRTFEEEPIRTRSMAQLLAAQGHRERALAIYEELLAKNSSDEVLLREVASLRRGEPPVAVSLPEPGRERASQAPSGVWTHSKERLSCEGAPSAGLTLRWAITKEGERRARAVLGIEEDDGELTVRLISIRPDAERIVRSEITEHGPIDASGEWSPGPLIDAERCVAAVGLRAGDRFVSIVHAQPLAHQSVGA